MIPFKSLDLNAFYEANETALTIVRDRPVCFFPPNANDKLFARTRGIDGVCEGRTLIHPHVARQLVERFRILARAKKSGTAGAHGGGLTTRELEILLEMATGATDREIAHKIFVSTTTVKSHIRSIFRKIGARNRTEAVVYVLKHRLIN